MAVQSSILDIGQISGQISDVEHIRGEISDIGHLTATLSSNIGGGGRPFYQGPYLVIPKAYDEQILETRGKAMRDDVTVTKVPFYETHNESGTTVCIAMEV